MVSDLACFALFLAHDHESVKKFFFLFCGIKIANTASLAIDQASVILTHTLPSRKSTKHFHQSHFQSGFLDYHLCDKNKVEGMFMHLVPPVHITTTFMT